MQRVLISVAVALVIIIASIPIEQIVRVGVGYYSEVTKLIEMADPIDRHLPQPTRDILLTSLHGQTAPYSAGLLIAELIPEASHVRLLSWHITFAAWTALTAVGFSDEERLALIAQLAPTGGGHHGLNETALVRFGHPLSELSPEQAAELVVLTAHPGLFDSPDHLRGARERLLSKCVLRDARCTGSSG